MSPALWLCASLAWPTVSGVADRKVIKISVRPEAKATIKKFADQHGLKEIVVAGRMYEWFSEQDDVVQKAILGLLPAGMEADIAKLALKRIAAGKLKGR